jgi:hypothetical protein
MTNGYFLQPSTKRWPRVRVQKSLVRKDWRQPPATASEATELEKAGLLWLDDESGQRCPYLVFSHSIGDNYDVEAAYEGALTRHNPRDSPHTLLRTVQRPIDVLNFLEKFGPLLDAKPHVAVEGGRKSPAAMLIDLQDFERRRKCYQAVLRLYDALEKPKMPALRREWRDVAAQLHDLVRGGLPIIDAVLDYDDNFVGFIVKLSDETYDPACVEEVEIGPGKRGFSKWLEEAQEPELRDLAEATVRLSVEGHAGGLVWSTERDGSGRMRFRQIVELGSLWAAVWNFFALDTQEQSLWRLCPHCGKLFWPPRRDRYYCTARQQQLHSKREWARQHRVEGR